MSSEPVAIVSVIVAVILAALPHLHTFGVPITPEQTDALNQFLPSVLVLIGGVVARAKVTPVQP